jgi:hypothetical protein
VVGWSSAARGQQAAMPVIGFPNGASISVILGEFIGVTG